MSELIDKQAALDALRSRQTYLFDSKDPDKKIELRSAEMAIEELPTVQPDHVADIGKKVCVDTISRQAAIDLFPNDALEWDTKGGYIAPHLARRMICELPFAQPDHVADIGKKVSISCGQENDLISRQAAIDALARMMPRSYTPDGSHPADEEIFRAQEVFADCIEALEILPSVQPATNCSEIPNGSDDTISRQAAIDAAMRDVSCIRTHEFNAGATRAAYRIKQLPSAQPERKKGHWIGSDGSYICSECNGSPIDFIDTMGISFDAYIGTLMNYCPNCGAYMRGGDVE